MQGPEPSDITIEESIYPALYRAADAASQRAQRTFLNWVQLHSGLLICGAGLAVYGIECKWSALLAAALFLGALLTYQHLASREYESVWYRSRALAESVKTSTWRFMMRAEPFNESTSGTAKLSFVRLLRDLLREHPGLASELGGETSKDRQTTECMLLVRKLPLDKRKSIYCRERIDDQQAWYAAKSSHNRDQASFWSRILAILQLAAIVTVLVRVAYPWWTHWLTEIFVVAASSVVTWVQVKRFRELAAAYGLTAHEVGAVREQLAEIDSEEGFQDFVVNAEGAFSREHTQWLARRE